MKIFAYVHIYTIPDMYEMRIRLALYFERFILIKSYI